MNVNIDRFIGSSIAFLPKRERKSAPSQHVPARASLAATYDPIPAAAASHAAVSAASLWCCCRLVWGACMSSAAVCRHPVTAALPLLLYHCCTRCHCCRPCLYTRRCRVVLSKSIHSIQSIFLWICSSIKLIYLHQHVHGLVHNSYMLISSSTTIAVLSCLRYSVTSMAHYISHVA
jgi:hypothetical protein